MFLCTDLCLLDFVEKAFQSRDYNFKGKRANGQVGWEKTGHK